MGGVAIRRYLPALPGASSAQRESGFLRYQAAARAVEDRTQKPHTDLRLYRLRRIADGRRQIKGTNPFAAHARSTGCSRRVWMRNRSFMLVLVLLAATLMSTCLKSEPPRVIERSMSQ